ncbi:uncharacterized protein LACBIDRAFT_311349 [Laccaria bicolor S238N-H82]|uniref:Predicted protein n=1 Tax=Laccaria bicolor (strain S238N-H82 / ATCC MYA-4686) TaxID=486041 RepID=B0CZT3_LACBS|nr:uncharacterized protein LACBIDRAFT_311349 [Laccaria bicolor S238N-H82]EDR12208.1 predicted protein [Laccaria bicolor S238N-H82]|eukprot:XP_001876472.1 predicted protein [Laccaria bicolor S238N-H82]
MMLAFHRKWTNQHSWILAIHCFMHSINTIIGKIIVSFFNSSHYWGGQLEKICKENGVTCGLKTNTESRFYALILQALSVHEHKISLMTLCVRDDEQQSQGSLTAVSKDVLATIFDVQRWQLTDQLIRVCKPLVDIIGDVESRDASLANYNSHFLRHAQKIVNAQFHEINTDIHWLTLFLHPLCCKLVISNSPHS